MADLLPGFPTRPLSLRPPVGNLRARLIGLLGAIVLFGLVAAMAVFLLPGIQSDLQIRNTALELGSSSVSDGHCTAHLGVVTTCDVTLDYSIDRNGPRYERRVHYLFTNVHVGDYQVSVMADPAQPALGTTDIGLDMLWNRIATAAVLALLLLVGGLACLATLLRGGPWQAASRDLDGKVLMPVRARLRSIYKGTWNIELQDGSGRRMRRAYPGRRFKPFALDEQGGILAVVPREGGRPVPLDAGLTWLDLTESERQQILAGAGRA